MGGKSMSGTKGAVLVVFGIVLMSVLVLAFLMEQNEFVVKEFQNSQPVQYRPSGMISTSNNLQAIVKGSIYESGSNMTVFGACEDGKGYLLPNATANFTAWYPNGTVLLGPNVSMDSVLEGGNVSGRFKVHITMPDAIGTYFTEMRCEYKNDYALAFGEWQNPEWVKRIGDTYQLALEMNGTLHNVSLSQEEMMVLLNSTLIQNISAILEALAGLNTTISNKTYTWVVDVTNTVFNVSQSGPRWTAVDMAGNKAFVGAKDGEYAYWNGVQWLYGAVPNVSWYGVSGMDPSLGYFWLVGRNGPYADVSVYMTSNVSEAIYSVGGSAPSTVENATAGAFVDVQLFRAPNGTTGQFHVLLLGNDGSLYHSENQGENWTSFWAEHNESYAAGGKGRISEIVWGTNDTDYSFAIATSGGTFMYHNGTIFRDDNMSRQYTGVVVTRKGLAFIVGVENNQSKIWRFDGTSLTEEGVLSDSLPNYPVGISANTENDVWITMDDPSIFYHYDGASWIRQVFEYAAYGYVGVSFGGAGPVVSGGDIAQSAEDRAYVVSGGGLMMKLVVEDEFQQIIGAIQLILIGSGSGGMSEAQYTALMGNITYTQGYLETVIYPLLVDIGIIKEQVNATLEIVNRTEGKIDELLNRSSGAYGDDGRPRVWTTQ